MKLILSLFAVLTIAASAFPARFKWNQNPEPDITQYRVYQLVDGVKVLRLQVVAPFELDADGKVRSAELDIESGQQYVVTAFNGFESEPSDPVTVPVKPSKPSGVQVVEIRVSTDLKTWETLAYVPLKKDGVPARFVQAGLTTINHLP